MFDLLSRELRRTAELRRPEWEVEIDQLLVPIEDHRAWHDRFPVTGVRERLPELIPKPSKRRLFLDQTAEIREDNFAAELTLLILEMSLRDPSPDVLVILRDSDGMRTTESLRRAGRWFARRSAVAGSSRRIRTLVLGLANQEGESWVILGLRSDPALTSRRASAKREVGVDPCARPADLTAATRSGPKDAKRVLRFLLGEGERVADAPATEIARGELGDLLSRAFADLSHVDSNDDPTNLADFHSRLRTQVVPLVIPGPS